MHKMSVLYPEKDQFVSEEQFNLFLTQLKEYIKNLMDDFSNKNLEKIQQKVNINSLIDYLIIDQIMGEQDHYWKSFNMYYTNTSSNAEENGKINFGPIWDYDWSLYTPWTGKPNEYYEVSDSIRYSNLFFGTVAEIPELYNVVKERYHLYAKEALKEYIAELNNLVQSMEESIRLNNTIWYSHIGEDLSVNNIEFLKKFLQNRKKILDQQWIVN